jgi:ABC transport system ATP-binding/permease protein
MELVAKDITVCRNTKVILDKVSFHINESTLTAIIGPNGAGKTTLMRALTGEFPEGGGVYIKGQDIYEYPEFWLRQIGYVPVDNILHEQLLLEEALLYIGKLRLPDLPRAKIEDRVNRLLTEFGFPENDSRRQKPMHVLSSGERKRANICSELIIDPEILMLDEPTSNLDPNAEYNLMTLLASYAHNHHKTILVITHTLNTIDLCDKVIYIENGFLRENGNPKQVLEALEARIDASVETSSKSPFVRWANIFEKTKTNPEQRRDCSKSKSKKSTIHSKNEIALSTTSWVQQFRFLFSRYMQIRLGDKGSLIGTLLAGFSGILFFSLPGNTFINPFEISERAYALNQARQSIYVISLIVTLLGMITSYTEISKEFRIYSHERLKGLSPSAYFLSKWVWLVFAVGILAPVLLLLFIVLVYGQPLPDFPTARIGENLTWWENIIQLQLPGLLFGKISRLMLLTMIFSCITSITLGMMISSLAADTGRGYLYLSFMVVFVVLFSGLIRNPKLESLIDTLSFLSTGKWSYEGIASSIGIYCWLDSWRLDEFNSTGHLLSIALSLGLFNLIGGFLAIALLHVRDPWLRPSDNVRHLILKNWKNILVLTSIIVFIFSYTVLLRSLSAEYHVLNYWNRAEYGGSNAYHYAHIEEAENPNVISYWSGVLSQSRCNNP